MAAMLPRAVPWTRWDQKSLRLQAVQAGQTAMCSRRSPARSSHRALAPFRSTEYFPGLDSGRMKGAASSPSPVRRPSGTSLWVSKQQGPIPGPMAARMCSGAQP